MKTLRAYGLLVILLLLLSLGSATPAQACACICTCCKPMIIGHSGSCSFVCFLTGSDSDTCYYADCYQTGCG